MRETIMQFLRGLVGAAPQAHRQPVLASGPSGTTPRGRQAPRYHESHGPELAEAEAQIADLEVRAQAYLSGGASNQRE